MSPARGKRTTGNEKARHRWMPEGARGIGCGAPVQRRLMAMCLACSAYCANCHPATLVGLECPDCEETSDFTRGECLYILGYPHRRTLEDEELAAAGAPRSALRSCRRRPHRALRCEVSHGLPLQRYRLRFCLGASAGKARGRPGMRKAGPGKIGSMPGGGGVQRREAAHAAREHQSVEGIKMGPRKDARIRGAATATRSSHR